MKGTRLFFVHCQGDGSWLTTREPKGRVFDHNPPDPMLVTGPVAHAEWQGAYNLVPTPWTAEAWPDFQGKNAEVAALNVLLVARLQQHDGCSRFGTRDFALLNGTAAKDILDAISEAKAALVGDSNDAEHDALVSFVQAIGLEIPECDCDERSWHGEGHDSACPQRAWQKEGN